MNGPHNVPAHEGWPPKAAITRVIIKHEDKTRLDFDKKMLQSGKVDKTVE